MRAQAAMEYLMTYGWALLIVVIVGVALWSLGVFNVGAGNVIRLTGANSVQLIDANKTGTGPGNNVTMILGFRKAMDVTTIKLGGVTCNGVSGSVTPGKKYTVNCNNVDVTNAMDFEIDYNDAVSGMQHKETGTLTGLSS